jgi:hypothetical protein
MKLLPKDVRKQLPPLGATAQESDPLVICKFFFPSFQWTWYAIEFDGNDLVYGFVDSDVPELGTFSLSELTSNRDKLGLSLERDLYFKPCRLSVLRARLGR